MTLMMTSVQVVESSVNVNHNLPTYDVACEQAHLALFA